MMGRTVRPRWGLTVTTYALRLLVRLALAVRDVGMLAGGLRMALRFRRFLVTLGVFAFAMMFGGSPMALSGSFVMFRRLGMSFLRHSIFLCSSVDAG